MNPTKDCYNSIYLLQDGYPIAYYVLLLSSVYFNLKCFTYYRMIKSIIKITLLMSIDALIIVIISNKNLINVQKLVDLI